MCSCQGIDHGRGCVYFGIQQASMGLYRDQEAMVVEGRAQASSERQYANADETARIERAQDAVSKINRGPFAGYALKEVANGAEAARIQDAQAKTQESQRQEKLAAGYDWNVAKKEWIPPWDPHPKQEAFMEAKQVGAPLVGTRPSNLGLRLRRANFIQYLYDKVSASDWHAVSDAANDLRELDVEIRMTEEHGQGNRTTPAG